MLDEAGCLIGINCFDKFIDIGLEGSYDVTCKALKFRGVLENKIKLIFVIGLIDDDVHTGFVSTADDNITMIGFCSEVLFDISFLFVVLKCCFVLK